MRPLSTKFVVALQRDANCFKGGLADTATAAAAAYAEAIHVRKADNSTPDRVVRSMLRVIPGLGPTAVEGVAAGYLGGRDGPGRFMPWRSRHR